MRSIRSISFTLVRRAILTWLAALALILVGADHGLPRADDLAAFALPDGTRPVLCRAGEGDRPSSDGHGAACWIACAIVQPPALPAFAPQPSPLYAAPVERIHAVAERISGPRYWPAAQPRGPPRAATSA